jgi:hypothetical protein
VKTNKNLRTKCWEYFTRLQSAFFLIEVAEESAKKKEEEESATSNWIDKEPARINTSSASRRRRSRTRYLQLDWTGIRYHQAASNIRKDTQQSSEE